MQNKKEITEIVYYDCGEVTALSFYINGFLSKQKKYNYKFLIKREKPYFLKQSSLTGEWYKFVLRLGLFEFKIGNKHFIAKRKSVRDIIRDKINVINEPTEETAEED